MLESTAVERVRQDWVKYAKEPVIVENIGNTFFGFCGELAALRIFHVYNQSSFHKYNNRNRSDNTSNTSVGYDEDMDTWYFRLDHELVLERDPVTVNTNG